MKSLSRLARFVIVALLLSLAPEARAQCAQEALAGLGPVSPFGFPSYYVDQGGLSRVEYCVQANGSHYGPPLLFVTGTCGQYVPTLPATWSRLKLRYATPR